MSSIRAVGLLSGGLDSTLAARLLIEQGIEVLGLHLESPTACRSQVDAVARDLGIRLAVRPKGEEYLRLLRHPRFGYGKHMNPCLDCRLFMFRLGQPYLEEFGARFLFTGEVLGQRPMSQTREAMNRIDRVSGMRGWILRPLSARLLAATEPERRGWVDRSRLLDIYGRGRDRQLALAAAWGLRDFQSPGGGCLLTDARFSQRLSDLFEHTSEERTTMRDVELLRIGRHVRIDPALKIVLGRSHEENDRLREFAVAGSWLVEPEDFSGPTALICGREDEATLQRAIELVLHHSRMVEPGARLRVRGAAGDSLRAVGAVTEPAADPRPAPL